MYRLTPVIQHYAWGSRVQLAKLTGRPHPTQQPEAELWMGAHEAAPAGLTVDGVPTTLDRFIAADPARVLGQLVADRFEGRLPFLLKVLAPQQALSIQAHPDAQRARTAPAGTYVDHWAKPESLCAVSDFEVFAGLRGFDDIRAVVTKLGITAFQPLVEHAAGAPEPVSALLAAVLQGNDSTLVDEVVGACRGHRQHPAFDAIVRVSEQFPGDGGLAVLLLMEHVTLQPGDYVFVPAGVLHAYVRGVAVEVLANSDNIVRAGLTAKPLNVPELLHIVDPHADMLPERPNAAGRVSTYPVDVPHFRLRRVAPGVGEVLIDVAGPRIVLSLEGTTTVECGGQRLELASGDSCFLDAVDGPMRLAGTGTAYVTSVG